MTVRLVALVLDAARPAAVARFWAQALGWNLVEPASPSGGVELIPTDATTFALLVRPGAKPKTGPNRIHLDLTTSSVDDHEATVATFLAAGAQHVDIGQSADEGHVVLADPEGNELCVIEPWNRFLASCPRLGAVNGDGTRALGEFWSAALGWPLVWDHDGETAIQAPDGAGPKITWSGPPLMPRHGPERLHLHVAPGPGATAADALAELSALGARPLGSDDAPGCPGAMALADVDGNPFCLLDGG